LNFEALRQRQDDATTTTKQLDSAIALVWRGPVQSVLPPAMTTTCHGEEPPASAFRDSHFVLAVMDGTNFMLGRMWYATTMYQHLVPLSIAMIQLQQG
jgi:hypothetical protein